MHRLRVALILTACLAATGCGGEDSISKADFVERANTICKDGNAEIAKAAEDVGQSPSNEEIEAFATDTLIPNIRGQLADIRDLGFPEADADELEAIFDQADTIVDEVEEEPISITEGNPFAPINPDLTEYGLETCAE